MSPLEPGVHFNTQLSVFTCQIIFLIPSLHSVDYFNFLQSSIVPLSCEQASKLAFSYHFKNYNSFLKMTSKKKTKQNKKAKKIKFSVELQSLYLLLLDVTKPKAT